MHLLDDIRDTNNISKPFQLKTSRSSHKQPQTNPAFCRNRTEQYVIP